MASGDVDALQSLFEAMHKAAAETGDYSKLRQVNNWVSYTTRPDYLTTLEHWRDAYPQSPYPIAALGWAVGHQVWIYRGEEMAWKTPPEAPFAHRVSLAASERLMNLAWALDPSYLPASDGLFVSMKGRDQAAITDLLTSVFGKHPNRHSLRLAVNARDPIWGGSRADAFDLCLQFGDLIEGYSAELCSAEVAIDTRAHRAMRSAAYTTLREAEYRIDRYVVLRVGDLELGMPDYEFDEVRRIHKSWLRPGISLSEYEWYGSVIASRFDHPEYEAEMLADIQSFVLKRLEHDPLNVELLARRNDHLFYGSTMVSDPAVIEEFSENWRNMAQFGQHGFTTG